MPPFPEALELRPIGRVRSCFHQRFGTPRQAGLTPAAEGTLEPIPPWDRMDPWREIEGFSHLWLVFWMHLNPQVPARPLVRPPRLGGNRRVGVFASRSPIRPNPIGLSAVRLLGFDCTDEGVRLRLGGLDLVDGTPILDVKPYLPYADALPGARAGFAPEAPRAAIQVHFSAPVAGRLQGLGTAGAALRRLIAEVLTQDPRPAWRLGAARYGMTLADHEVHWRQEGERIEVTSVEPRPLEPRRG